MPGNNYKSVSIREELVDNVKHHIRQVGNYRSVAEFFSEAARLRLETSTKKAVKEDEAKNASAGRQKNH